MGTNTRAGHALPADGTSSSAHSAVVDVARKICAHALRITRHGAHGAIAEPIDARCTGGTFIGARSTILGIGGKMRANASAIVRRRSGTSRALTIRTCSTCGAHIAALTAVRGVSRKIETTRTAIHERRAATTLTTGTRTARTARNTACSAICGIGRRIDANVVTRNVRRIGTRRNATAATAAAGTTVCRRRRIVATAKPRQRRCDDAHESTHLQPPLKTVHICSSMQSTSSKGKLVQDLAHRREADTETARAPAALDRLNIRQAATESSDDAKPLKKPEPSQRVHGSG